MELEMPQINRPNYLFFYPASFSLFLGMECHCFAFVNRTPNDSFFSLSYYFLKSVLQCNCKDECMESNKLVGLFFLIVCPFMLEAVF